MTDDHTVAIVQARTNSSRLPGKVMMPLLGRPVLDWVLRRTTRARTVDRTVLATTNHDRDDVLEGVARRQGIETFRGSEGDVLQRFIRTADAHKAETVVRICADNPLVSPRIVNAVVDTLRASDADYASNNLERTFPEGLDVEAIATTCLRAVEEAATDSYYREHVTAYLHEESNDFTLTNLASEAFFEANRHRDRNDLRLTLDTAADYERLRRLFVCLEAKDIFRVEDAIDAIDQDDSRSRETPKGA